ncbi:FAD/NAD(P)-binding domain-containing protein [Cylindrobasidium torrendii FP15055 ss-10]|uniref:FAD/NAD(P)-binding domain-containing protein n=1 Tax=Cylindrobasidium torrendii FP15055 ss-10 TaxID=1314674 RepID=A0A0D7BEE9_9AGAR|nr:FAD/NAD(P)-binding domain-containing protein [Cylindrobasidium torrendii FP15055 ss-10]
MKYSWSTVLAFATLAARAEQIPLFRESQDDGLHHFDSSIKKVAVIGAGVSGLQIAAELIDHNFTVRLFDRAPGPGGNWLYTEETQIRESYPDAPVGADIHIPKEIPRVKYYAEGDEGRTLDERWREHWQPRPIWNSLTTNSPAVITELSEVPYKPDHTWVISAHLIQSHVRAYAAVHRLGPHDTPSPDSHLRFSPVTSYSTRVVHATRRPQSEAAADGEGKWTLTLQKYTYLPESARLKAEWWTEHFDAVVIATGGYDSVHVPEIKGIKEWSEVKQPEQGTGVSETFSIYHSVHYRRPERYADKVVLIVGPGTSGSEVARDIGPHVKKIYSSYRNTTPIEKQHPFQQRAIGRFPVDKTEWIPEIREFRPLKGGKGIKHGEIVLINGTIILATGYKRLNAFLDDELRNAYGKPPRDIFGGKTIRNLHWTGHFIPDPTLVFANVRPWNLEKYQALGIAKVFEGTAFLPNEEKRREEYAPGKFSGLWGTRPTEALIRQYVTWLNNESLQHGGRLVSPLPIEQREVFSYYSNQEWKQGYIHNNNFTSFEELGKEDWDWYHASDEANELWEQGLDW